MEKLSDVSGTQVMVLSSGKSLKGQEKSLISSEYIKNASLSALVSLGLAIIFFRSIWAVFVTIPAGIIFFRQQTVRTKALKKRQQRSQCKDALLGVASALSAGYALENAISQGSRTLKSVWGNDCEAAREWEKMEKGIQLHLPVEKVFTDYALRTGLNEMEQLAGLVSIAKRSGGGLSRLIKTAAVQLEESIMTENEIQTKLTEKRMELTIMFIMPPAILVYLQAFSYDIVAPLYEELWGSVFMAVCLFIYVAGWLIGMKLLDIEV